MYLLTLTQQLLREMRQRKLRSILAIFGIAFGTLTVIMLLALGTGFHDAGMRNITGIVDGSFFIWTNHTSKSFGGYPKGYYPGMRPTQLQDLSQVLPHIMLISPWLMQTTTVGYAGKQYDKSVYGATPDLQQLRKINLEPGSRFINPLDVSKQMRVAIVGNKLKTIVFGTDNPIGKKILINNIPFLIIGAVAASKEDSHNEFADTVIISDRSFTSLFFTQHIGNFMVKPYPEVDPKQFISEIRHYFSQTLHFAPDDPDAMQYFDTAKIFQFVRYFFLAIQIFLGTCGAMTLAVGSIGVANIMFLIVAERTREIGLRKALGANNWHILWQLLLETLIIVALGGGVGFLIAIISTTVLENLSLPDWLGTPTIAPATVAITIIILAIVGLLAGYFPANKAAKMDPVEAINK